jgi:hypothetical protein
LLKICLDQALKKQTIANRFKTSGLYPFDANAIDYSKLLEIQRPTSCHQPQHFKQGTVQTKPLLNAFEQRLPNEKLQEFNKSGKVWMGDIKDENLFYFWDDLKNENVNILPNVDNTSELLGITLDDEFWSGNENLLECTMVADGIVILSKD